MKICWSPNYCETISLTEKILNLHVTLSFFIGFRDAHRCTHSDAIALLDVSFIQWIWLCPTELILGCLHPWHLTVCVFLPWLSARSLDKSLPLASTTCWVSMRHTPGITNIYSIQTNTYKAFFSQHTHPCTFSASTLCVCYCRYRGWLVRRMCCALFVSGCKVYASPVSNRLERVCQSNRYLRGKRNRRRGLAMPEESK